MVFEDRRMQTVAVESEDLGALRSLCERIGIRAFRNRSYPIVIREALGIGG